MTKRAIELTNTRYRLGYHVSAPSGWINDPNGFCYFDGYYHVFYQHHPYSAEWGPMHWAHARSKDLVHWESLPLALTPEDQEDEGGCFSGSAIEKMVCCICSIQDITIMETMIQIIFGKIKTWRIVRMAFTLLNMKKIL